VKELGIDPSSARSGGALVEHRPRSVKLVETMLWEKNERRSHPWNLHNFFETVCGWCESTEADRATIEALSVARGAQVTRMIAFYQAAAVLGCKVSGLTVIEARVSTARMIVLGDGNMPKEEAHKAVKKKFPKHKFKRYDSGGSDETDATVLALAGPDISEA
jgi:Holliday junction resolvasome RuvABC endonuclease subunit